MIFATKHTCTLNFRLLVAVGTWIEVNPVLRSLHLGSCSAQWHGIRASLRSLFVRTKFNHVSVGVTDVHAGGVTLSAEKMIVRTRTGQRRQDSFVVEGFHDNADVIDVGPVWLGREQVDDRASVDPHGWERGMLVAPVVDACGFEPENVDVEVQGLLDIGALQDNVVEGDWFTRGMGLAFVQW